MKVAFCTTNGTFLGPIRKVLEARGHATASYTPASGFQDGFQLGTLMQWADLVFVDFVQSPLPEVVANANRPDLAVVARLHRIEMYGDLVTGDKLNWPRVDILFISAPHVMDRFMAFRAGKSKPAELVLAATNTVDREKFKFVERAWKPPYRLCLVGNFVPKKRQYTLIQMMYDVKKEFGDEFHLDIIGARGQWSGYGNPEYFQNCLDLIDDLGLTSHVSIFDKIDHEKVPEFYAREHVVISNSNEEGTHVSIAEGIATGCLAFVNHWHGVKDVYPDPQIAWQFKSPGEFMDLLRRFKTCVAANELAKRSVTCSTAVLETLGDPAKYEKMAVILEDLVKKKQALKGTVKP